MINAKSYMTDVNVHQIWLVINSQEEGKHQPYNITTLQ